MSPAADAMFAGLFVRYHRMLVGFLARMTRCPQRAEDLAQVVWVKLLQAHARGEGPVCAEQEIRAYLFTIGRNAFLDEYTRKHEGARTTAMDPSVIDALPARSLTIPGPDEAVEREQISAFLQAAVDSLPAEQGRVVKMWLMGTSIKDMAIACAAPADTVLSRKKYALARMRVKLAGAQQALN